MTSKEMLSRTHAIIKEKDITHREISERMGVSRAMVGRTLLAGDCYLSTFTAIVRDYEIRGLILKRMETPPYLLKTQDIDIKKTAKLLGMSPKNLRKALTASDMKLSTFIKICEASGIYNEIFKIN